MIFCELSIPNGKSYNAPVTHIIPTSLQSEETVAPRLLAVDEKTPIQPGTTVQTQGKTEVGETQTAKNCAYSAVDERCWFVPLISLFHSSLYSAIGRVGKHCLLLRGIQLTMYLAEIGILGYSVLWADWGNNRHPFGPVCFLFHCYSKKKKRGSHQHDFFRSVSGLPT